MRHGRSLAFAKQFGRARKMRASAISNLPVRILLGLCCLFLTFSCAFAQQNSTGKHAFMLSFDDGPMPGRTDRVLQALRQLRNIDGKPVKAAFFMIGDSPSAAREPLLLCPVRNLGQGQHARTPGDGRRRTPRWSFHRQPHRASQLVSLAVAEQPRMLSTRKFAAGRPAPNSSQASPSCFVRPICRATRRLKPAQQIMATRLYAGIRSAMPTRPTRHRTSRIAS